MSFQYLSGDDWKSLPVPSSWNDFVKLLKEEYLLPTYNQKLLDEISMRAQDNIAPFYQNQLELKSISELRDFGELGNNWSKILLFHAGNLVS